MFVIKVATKCPNEVGAVMVVITDADFNRHFIGRCRDDDTEVHFISHLFVCEFGNA